MLPLGCELSFKNEGFLSEQELKERNRWDAEALEVKCFPPSSRPVFEYLLPSCLLGKLQNHWKMEVNWRKRVTRGTRVLTGHGGSLTSCLLFGSCCSCEMVNPCCTLLCPLWSLPCAFPSMMDAMPSNQEPNQILLFLRCF